MPTDLLIVLSVLWGIFGTLPYLAIREYFINHGNSNWLQQILISILCGPVAFIFCIAECVYKLAGKLGRLSIW